MAKKMYYTEDEAAAKLGVGKGEVDRYVRDAKLRVFQDGAKRMFRADEVDRLAGKEEVSLAPGGDAVSLAEAETTRPAGKEDTVITAEGISIFDDEDLEIEAADPMAKTQIAPSIEDQVALEGVGSGSGLLDLTRESDDTSLGAEVLDHIDLEEETGTAAAAAAAPIPAAAASAAGIPQEIVEPALVAPSYVEAVDAGAGLFGGMVVGSAVVSSVLAAVALTTLAATPPDYVGKLQGNLGVVLGAAAVVMIVGAVLGFVAGKASADRREAMRQMSAGA